MSKNCIHLSDVQFKKAIDILTNLEIELEREKKNHSKPEDDIINPNGEMPFSEIKKALILSRESKEAIFIDAEPLYHGKTRLQTKPYQGDLLPSHLHSSQQAQGGLPNCWFHAALLSILRKLGGSKFIASLFIDLEKKIVIDNEVVSLGKLLGLKNDKKIMVRLIKNGLPRYCIVDKSEVINTPVTLSEFYIQALEKAHVGLFFEGDYQKVAGSYPTEAYKAFFYTEPKSLNVNELWSHEYYHDQFKHLNLSLTKTQEYDIFKDDKKAIAAFHLLLSRFRQQYPLPIALETKKFFYAVGGEIKELNIKPELFSKIMEKLVKYEETVKNPSKFHDIFSKKILKIFRESNVSDGFPICLTVGKTSEPKKSLKPTGESIQKDGLVTTHSFAVDRYVSGLEFYDSKTNTTLKSDVIYLRNPWGNPPSFDQDGKLVNISRGGHGVGIKNRGGKLKFFDSHDSVTQVTPEYLLKNTEHIAFVEVNITTQTSAQLSKQSVDRLLSNLQSEKAAATSSKKAGEGFWSLFSRKSTESNQSTSPSHHGRH